MQIEVKDLTYVYSEGSRDLSVKALDKVSLTINEGEFFFFEYEQGGVS